MKNRAFIAIVPALLLLLCLPFTAMADDLMDKDADPPVVTRSGSFEALYKTRADFELSGGKLTKASWTRVQGHVGYGLKGTFKPGEEITLSFTGTQSPVPDTNSQADLVWNVLDMKMRLLDSGGKLIGDELKTTSGQIKRQSESSAVSSPIPPEAAKVVITGSFLCRWATPYTVAQEAVAVTVELTAEEPATAAPAAAAPAVVARPTPQPTLTPTPTKQPEPVIQVVSRAAVGAAGEDTTDVKTAAIIGILATMAALGAAGASAGSAAGSAAGSTSHEVAEEAARQKTGDYRMVVFKTFGDTIELDKSGQEVYARIESIDPATGTWSYDVAKSMAVTISFTSSAGLSQGPAPALAGKGRGMSFVYRNAEPAPGTKTTLALRYTAPDGGYFERRMEFNLAGKPEITIEKKVNLLSTEDKLDLPYRLAGCGEDPQIAFSCPSGLVEADLSVGFEEKERFLRLSPAQEAIEWDKTTFVKPVKCTFEVQYGEKPEDKVSTDFEVSLCYQGIGTAYENCSNGETAEEFRLHCFGDDQRDEREKQAFRLPLTVMRWNEADRKLEPDVAASEQLEIEFVVRAGSKSIKADAAAKALKDAEITIEMDTTTATAKTDKEKKPTLYMIYPSENVLVGVPEIELQLVINDQGGEFETLTLPATLLPQADFKSMITWFIGYGEGTYVDKYLKIGDVAIYHGALDFIDERVYSTSTCPYSPKLQENHYEDGEWDVRRPTYVFLKDGSMPRHIGEFTKIQSLHHELAHAVEQQHGDTGDGLTAERHAWPIQHLTDVVEGLADMERGATTVEGGARRAMQRFYDFYNDDHNASPQTFGWFGVDFVTQHYLFERYAILDTSGDSSMPEPKKLAVARFFREHYFPGRANHGNTSPKYRETAGVFRNAVWTLELTTSFVGYFTLKAPEHPGYSFTEVSKPQWIPGTLRIKASYDVEAVATGKRDILHVVLDGGSFNPLDPTYPAIDKFTVTWSVYDRISDSILGTSTVVSEAVRI